MKRFTIAQLEAWIREYFYREIATKGTKAFFERVRRS